MILRCSSIVIALLANLTLWSQLPAKQVNNAGFRQELYGGFMLHSSGWGGTMTYGKFQTYKTKRIFSLDLASMKHPKEVKIQGYVDQNSKDFVYGKLSGLMLVRVGYGQKRNIFEKLRDKGVAISWQYSFGPSIGFLKPVYLDIVNILPNGTIAPPKQEAYNPEKHHLGNIYGRSKGIRGLSETSVVPGAFFKAGLEFEYNHDREFIRSIETGIAVDVYPKKVDIMAFTENRFFFPTVYVKLLIGKRFF